MVRFFAFVVLCLGCVFVAACRQEVGGPCVYKKLDTTGVVIAVDSDVVVLQLLGVESEVKVSMDRFTGVVELGAQYQMKVERIEKGTCVPLIVVEISSYSK